MSSRRWLVMILIVAALFSVEYALAANSYTLVTWTVANGGGTLTGGSYTLSATVGQPDAGIMAGGGYTLLSGFWGSDVSGETEPDSTLYLPSVTAGEATQSQNAAAEAEHPSH